MIPSTVYQLVQPVSKVKKDTIHNTFCQQGAERFCNSTDLLLHTLSTNSHFN